ncbi:hypothetical protein FJZ31_07555 [Candidatus Poribacteria bacterium]|nr:hypothetical protein [Candidatus Poribacteria bacterium]
MVTIITTAALITLFAFLISIFFHFKSLFDIKQDNDSITQELIDKVANLKKITDSSSEDSALKDQIYNKLAEKIDSLERKIDELKSSFGSSSPSNEELLNTFKQFSNN